MKDRCADCNWCEHLMGEECEKDYITCKENKEKKQ